MLAAPANEVGDILQTFNAYHNRLKFTVEHEKNRSLQFLDLTLNILNNKFHIDWYHKETFSGRILSYFSNHPLCHKIGTIYSLVDRAILLSHPSYHKKNLELCINILIDNGYPLRSFSIKSIVD